MTVYDALVPELSVLIPLLWLCGRGLKKSRFPDEFIPVTLGGLGILFTGLYLLSQGIPTDLAGLSDWLYKSFTQGLISASGSVYAQNIIKQSGLWDGKTQTDDKTQANGKTETPVPKDSEEKISSDGQSPQDKEKNQTPDK